MADKKISQLPALQELSGDEQIPVSKEGVNYKVSAEDLSKGNVRYDEAQELTTSQQWQARANIAAMANTPSGDPMHYMYEAAGMVYHPDTDTWSYQATGMPNLILPIIAGLTTGEVRYAYANTYYQLLNIDSVTYKENPRITFVLDNAVAKTTSHQLYYLFSGCINLKYAYLGHITMGSCEETFYNCIQVVSIAMKVSASTKFNLTFTNCTKLVDAYIYGAGQNILIIQSNNISSTSLAYTIRNANKSNNFTIKLSSSAYERLMADEDIIAALEETPNVTLSV